MPRSEFGVRSQFNLVAVIIFGLAAVTAWIGAPSVACSEEAAANDTATLSESNPIVVWVDATRKPGIEAFIKANPDVPVKLVLYGKQYGSPQLQEKFSLWNRTGSGWPDMIFFGDVQDMAWAASPAMHYAATLNTLVPPAVQSGFLSLRLRHVPTRVGSFACGTISRLTSFGTTWTGCTSGATRCQKPGQSSSDWDCR